MLLSGVFLFAQAATTVTTAKSAATKPAEIQAAATQPYKDPEDMTTRYRPGSNQTTQPTDQKSMGSAHATESVAKKHVAGVKYSDRSAPSPAPESKPEPAKQ
jgi:hypothetical protein